MKYLWEGGRLVCVYCLWFGFTAQIQVIQTMELNPTNFINKDFAIIVHDKSILKKFMINLYSEIQDINRTCYCFSEDSRGYSCLLKQVSE